MGCIRALLFSRESPILEEELIAASLTSRSSQSRLHGSKSFRVPWLYDNDGKDEASKVLAKMVKAKLRLMPYLFAQVSHFGT